MLVTRHLSLPAPLGHSTLEDARRYLQKKGVTFNKKWLPAIGPKRRGILILAAYLLLLYL
jgi:hypothetical protein